MLVDAGDFIDKAITPEAVKIGECMDINDQGYAVGWFLRNGSTDDEAFILDPTNGGAATVLPLSYGFDRARAIAINSGNFENTFIVGWAEDDQGGASGHEAVFWSWDSVAEQWELSLIFPDNRRESESQAVTDGGRVIGFFVDAMTGENRGFRYENGGATVIKDGANFVPLGANDRSSVAGHLTTLDGDRHSYFYSDTLEQDLHDVTDPGGIIYDSSIALAMNSSDDVVGYATGTSGNPPFMTTFNDPLYWWRDVNDGWHAEVLSAVQPDPIDAFLTAVGERFSDGSFDIVGDYATDFTKGVFYIVVDSLNLTYSSYWLDAVTGTGSNDHPSMVLYPRAVRDTAMTWTANGINNRSAIAGSYKPDKNTLGINGVRPCLYVPNDFNNNAIPDLHEILLGHEPDGNNNKMIDWAENDPGTTYGKNMRAGLHAPGLDGKVNGGSHMLAVDHTQIVRFPVKLTNIPPGQINLEEDYYSIENIVNGDTNPATNNPTCMDFFTLIREWSTIDENDNDQQREIIVTVTNPHPDDPNFDKILTPADGPEWSDALDDIRTFAFRFANCIDYMQMGNESLKGSSEWGVPDGQGGVIGVFELTGTNFTDELADGVEWVRDQAEAARIGSALAGRPLRIITPGFPVGVINTGAEGDPEGSFDNSTMDVENRSARGMRDIGLISRSDRMFFDVHIHYLRVEQAYEGLDNMEDSTLLAWNGGDAQPSIKVLLEFGPKGDKDHEEWPNFESDIGEFFRSSGNPRFSTWDEMLKSDDDTLLGWEREQFTDATFGDGFQMPAILAQIDLNEYTAVCYGPSLQGPQAADPFQIAALRASKVADSNWICEDNHFFSPILRYTPDWSTCTGFSPGNGDDYETIIEGFVIPNFQPHCVDGEGNSCDGCEVNRACPNS